MRLHSYIIYSDSGFAPNPYWGYCTLATCKPDIRREAHLGDWVLATGTNENVGTRHLVYAMRIEEKLGYEDYFRDPRFDKKIVSNPDVSPECRGDNMYFTDERGQWYRALLSFRHAELWRVKDDLRGRFVLIAKKDYWYFGRDAVLLPSELFPLVHSTKGDTWTINDGEAVDNFIAWLRGKYSPGRHADPFQCITKTSYGKTPEQLPDNLASLL